MKSILLHVMTAKPAIQDLLMRQIKERSIKRLYRQAITMLALLDTAGSQQATYYRSAYSKGGAQTIKSRFTVSGSCR